MLTKIHISGFTCALLVILLQSQLCQAQQTRLDSLLKVLSIQKTQDTARANTLIDLTTEYLQSGSKKAHTTASEAYLIAQKHSSRSLRARASNALGNAESQRKNWSDSRKLLEEGLSIAESIKEERTVAGALNGLSVVWRGTGELEKALAFSERALVLLEKHRDERAMCMTLLNIGNILSGLGKLDEALVRYDRALKLGEKKGLNRAVVFALEAQGSVYQRQKKYDLSLQAHERGRRICEQTGNTAGVASSLLCSGWVHYLKDDNDEALDLLKQSLKLYEKLGDKRSLAKNLRYIGKIFFKTGRYTEAYEPYTQCLKLLNELEDKRAIYTLQVDMGNVLMQQGQFSQARELYTASLTSSRAALDKASMNDAILNLGIIHDKQGRSDSAAICYQEVLDISKGLSDPDVLCKVYNNIANIYQGQGNLEEALKYYNLGLEIAEKNELPDLAMLLSNTGAIHGAQGRLDKALQYHQRAHAISEKRGDKRIMVLALQYLAQIFWDQGRIEDSRKYNIRCMNLSEEMGDKRGMAESYGKSAMYENHVGAFDKALKHINMATNLCDRMGDKRGLARALYRKAIVYRTMGEYGPAMEYHQQSLDIREALGDIEGTTTSLLDIAILLAEKEKYDEAITSGERAHSLAQKHGYAAIIRKSANVLSDIWVAKQNYEKAYHFYRNYTLLKDSMLSEANQRYITELKEKYDADQREHQIRFLQKEKELKDLDLARSQDALRLNVLEASRNAHEFELDLEMQRHENNKTMWELTQRNTSYEKNAKLLEMTQRDKALSDEVAKNNKRLKYALIGGLFLTFLLALAFINRFKQKQKLSELRVREAEFHAQSATMQAMGFSLESERKERALQQQFARRLLTSQEEERSRIARELHDSLSQGLIVMKNRALMGMRSIDNPDKLNMQLQAISDAAGDTLKEVRQISRDLRPHQLDNLGLSEALRGMIHTISESTEISFTLGIENIDGIFDHDGEIALYRIVQEAMTNIHKHSAAHNVEITTKKTEAGVSMVIRDDGVGFDVPTLLNTGFGLQSMAERIKIIGGTIKIESSPGNGTVIRLTLPSKMEVSHPLISTPLRIPHENGIIAS